MNHITLNNGVEMPLVGLGTYQLSPDEAQASVTFALDNGYELIDTANVYVNERGVGRGMRASTKAREDVFLETKLWPSFYDSGTAVDETLERLGVAYIDLMILHQPAGNIRAGYRKLEDAYRAGKLRSIGISNFNAAEVQHLIDECEVMPALIQTECHPYFPQTELKKLLAQHNIALQAWYPLGGRGNDSIMGEPLIGELAKAHGKSPGAGHPPLARAAGQHRHPGIEDPLAHRPEHRALRLRADGRGDGADRGARPRRHDLPPHAGTPGPVPPLRSRRRRPEIEPRPRHAGTAVARRRMRARTTPAASSPVLAETPETASQCHKT